MCASVLHSSIRAALPEADAIAAIKSELEKQSADNKFSGAVLIAKDGKPVFQAAYGYADRENKVTNSVDTKIHFGSMGKMFTSVAVLQLVQAGKISLEAPVSKYLPDYPNKEVAAVTIYQLLTHTGGTGDIFSPEFEAHRKELNELKDYVALYGQRGVQFKPGNDWDYSNYGFILLGRIIELTSGQNYNDYLKDHVFNPAGMNSSGNLPEEDHVPQLAICYTGPGGPGLRLIGPGAGPESNKDGGGGGLHIIGPVPGSEPGPNGPGLHIIGPGDGGEPGPDGPGLHIIGLGPGSEPGADGPGLHILGSNSDSEKQSQSPKGSLRPTKAGRGTSAGGGYSTVGDFLKFANALSSHTLLNAHFTDLLTTGKVATRRPGIKYAFGFEDEIGKDGVRRIGHGGGSPGMNGRLSIYPNLGYVIIALANIDPPAADGIEKFISNQLPPE